MPRLSDQFPDLLASARSYVTEPVPYRFSPSELDVLENFFSNTRHKIFYVNGLPSNMMASLTSMYSRLKNPRGLRGVFVDSFLPSVLATNLSECQEEFDGDSEKFLKDRGLGTLQEFIDYSQESRRIFRQMTALFRIDPEYVKTLADSKKAKRFLDAWLDKYGHNSIARMGNLCICFERISMLAAKSIEWSRPGSGYVELSSRYVDMGGNDMYPIVDDLTALDISTKHATSTIDTLFKEYKTFIGEDLDGEFPKWLVETYGSNIEKPATLKLGVSGETYDVGGNLLPAGTLTSLCATVSGEAFPSLLRHLRLDDTPENDAIVEFLVEEGKKTGADQFARHYDIGESEAALWRYLDTTPFERESWSDSSVKPLGTLPSDEPIAQALALEGYPSISSAIATLFPDGRTGEKDFRKLPRAFETVTCAFKGVMPFRDWRDLQRMGMSTHKRTFLTPRLGFYQYDKPHPLVVDEAFAKAEAAARAAYEKYEGTVPAPLLQYLMPLGCNVGFLYAANIRQHEFCNWQRGKSDVNHSVRQIFIDMEVKLRETYTWYAKASRGDITRKYVFARGSNLKLED
jgi:thymidylate synthase ThyX